MRSTYTPPHKKDMPEQITPLSVLYLLLHGAGTAVGTVLYLYLAQKSGYHSYSTFSTAFKQRMHKSVTAWMREEVLI